MRVKHLWQYEHPYYMTEGCYFSGECHNEYESFDAFLEDWGKADVDYNWVIRWDWLAPSKEDKRAHHELKIQFFIQRKAYPISCAVKVTPEDEPRVLEALCGLHEKDVGAAAMRIEDRQYLDTFLKAFDEKGEPRGLEQGAGISYVAMRVLWILVKDLLARTSSTIKPNWYLGKPVEKPPADS